MYIGSMEEKIRDAKITRQVTDLAGCGEEFPFVKLNAASDAQRNFAGDVRLHAVSQTWEELDKEYYTPEMAKAIIAIVNRRKESKWWLDNKNADFLALFADELEAALGGK